MFLKYFSYGFFNFNFSIVSDLFCIRRKNINENLEGGIYGRQKDVSARAA